MTRCSAQWIVMLRVAICGKKECWNLHPVALSDDADLRVPQVVSLLQVGIHSGHHSRALGAIRLALGLDCLSALNVDAPAENLSAEEANQHAIDI